MKSLAIAIPALSGALVVTLICGVILAPGYAAADGQAPSATVTDMNELPNLAPLAAPTLIDPTWAIEQRLDEAATNTPAPKVAAVQAPSELEPVAPQAPTGPRVVTYSVATRGSVGADPAELAAVAQLTLNDSRGWGGLGLSFQQVDSGGNFTLYLAEASALPSFSSACSQQYSCRAGRNVVINQDTWLGATPAWNEAGNALAEYRNMVINHEVGHWLGHKHRQCSAPGQPAPLMQQQSISLQGCTANAWPLPEEHNAPSLGI